MTPIHPDNRRDLLVIGFLVCYLIFAAVAVSSADSFDQEAGLALFVFGAGALMSVTALARLRLHSQWHAGKIGLLWAVGVMVGLFSPVRVIALPLLLAAAAFTWFWLPDKRDAGKSVWCRPGQSDVVPHAFWNSTE
jgi:hypothetical protein